MKQIEVLGPGCSRCKVLYEHAEAAARELGIEYEIKKVTDVGVLVGYGVMATPALVVNGELKLWGRVPSAKELKEILS